MEVNFDVKLNRVIFESNNGYKIVKCIDNSTNEEITLVGHFMPVINNESYVGVGKEINHPTYGHQIEVVTIEQSFISDSDKLVEYFSSGLFFGIGKKTALKIVEVLGENAIEKILNDSSVLNDVPNLSERKCLKLAAKVAELNDTTNVFNYLLSLGLSQKLASKLYSDYGDDVAGIIKEDVFIIYYNDSGKYNFKNIFEVSKILNYEYDDVRVTSGILYNFINSHTFNNGNTYVTREEFNNDIYNVDSSIEYLINLNYLVEIDGCISIKKMFEAEQSIANFIKVSSKSIINEEIEFDFDEELDNFCASRRIKFSLNQVNAIRSSFQNRVSIITGGPGTGKTTIVNAICNIYLNRFNLQFGDTIFDNELVLLAPTGRAAKRMNEQTGIVASTIHRYLKWDMDKNTFEYNNTNKARAKVVVIDEVSMVDTFLFASLIQALDSNIIMIIIGDDMQLPAVGCGDILSDLISSNVVHISTLTDVYRQNSDSLLTLMHGVRNYNVPADLTTKYEDRNFIRCVNNQIYDCVSKVLGHIASKKLDIFDFQILVPMYKGDVGIDNLNKLCQNIFNEPKSFKKELKVGSIIFRVGDKVLLTKNFPNENVYNGDIGVVKNVAFNSKFNIEIDFDGHVVEFAGEDVYSIIHGYAISIHKSQGSEFKHVIMPISLVHRNMLKHNLIYTGITRAKDSLLIVGEESTFVNSVCDNTIEKRKTNLQMLINEEDISPFDFM